MEWQFYWSSNFLDNFKVGSSKSYDIYFNLWHVVRWIGPFQFKYWKSNVD